MKEVENKDEVKVKWTEDQQKAIYTRYRDVLVSAAAGSGKTAVLVERIINIITDKDNPVDIDKLLIVTFTNAAAAEMRERIGEAISKKLEKNSKDSNLQKQLTLLNKANISTLHSFCLNLIRNNFHHIDLDPNFRVGDNTEIALLRGEALDELFEEKYSEENQSFLDLIESYCDNKSDGVLYDIILKLYSFSMSTPNPVKWLNLMAENFNVREDTALNHLSFKDEFFSDILEEFTLAQRVLRRAIKIVDENSNLEKYRNNLDKDIEIVDTAKELLKNSVEEAVAYIEQNSFGKLVVVKVKTEEEKFFQEEVKSYRKKANDLYKGISSKVSDFTSNHNIIKMRELYPLMKELSQLVIKFKEKFDKKKRERGIIDFNDQEHFALEILKNCDEDGNEFPSDIAISLRDKFEEILVDEYQDSNDVQEELVTLISRKKAGFRNRFMVGDLKQSIYRFRMAKPELFKDKKDSYSREEGQDNRLITLHKNFRSREEVIDGINYFFRLLMSEKVGELEYNEEEELKLGADYIPLEEAGEVGGPLEFHIISLDDEDENKEEQEELSEEEIEEEELSSIQVEARFVGERIKELMALKKEKAFKVYDKNINGYRNVTFKDIVILLRSGNKFAPIFVEEFKKLDIPLYAEAGTGYFDTLEVKTIISLLQIIDNPRQDIPLMAVLRSPIGAFTAEDLMEIRLINGKVSFYDAMREYLISDKVKMEEYGENLKGKIRGFFLNLNIWRNRSRYTPINELVWELYTETGYYGFVGAMPGGAQRQANLRILFQRAKEFEKTSYKGLYNFINFINNLQKTSEDLGAAKIIGENEDVVRVMSIHKSKGLEFPIVFLCGMSKQFNQSDLRSKILFHHKLGYGPTFVDLHKRITSSTIQRDYISKKIQSENKSEEMRLLYVALTRAKEKLILVSSHKNLGRKIEQWGKAANEDENIISEHYVSMQKSYADWIGPAIMKHEGGEALRSRYGNFDNVNVCKDESKILISFHNKDKFAKANEDIKATVDIEERLREIENSSVDEESKATVKKGLEYKYKYEASTKLPTVITVSKLKNINIDNITKDDTEDRLKDDYGIDYRTALIKAPMFLQEKKGLTPAEVGTALHGVMQRLDLDNVSTVEEIQNQINMMIYKELLTEEQGKAVRANKIHNFFTSDLGSRVINAHHNKRLKRELPFRMEISSTAYESALPKEIYDEEKIVLRGILDCYFEENGEGIIVDYKTDYVSEENTSSIIERYKSQLNFYKEAVEKLLGIKVAKKYLYLFSIDKAVEV